MPVFNKSIISDISYGAIGDITKEDGILIFKIVPHAWRMCFNPDPQKQAIELTFSRKKTEIDHPAIFFNNIPVKKVSEHKHLGIILDSKLSFSAHIKSAISKTRKGIGLLKYLSKYLPRHTLNELYKLNV